MLHFILRTHAHAIAIRFALHFTHTRACHRHTFCTSFHARTHAQTHARTQVCNTFLGSVTYMSHERVHSHTKLICACHCLTLCTSFTHTRTCHRHTICTSFHAHTHMPSPLVLHFILRTHAHAIATLFALYFTHTRASHCHTFCTSFYAHACMPPPHILHFILSMHARTHAHRCAIPSLAQ